MTETTELDASLDASGVDAITEALAIIDGALGEMLNRELVSTSEVADLLLDVRSILKHDAPVLAPN